MENFPIGWNGRHTGSGSAGGFPSSSERALEGSIIRCKIENATICSAFTPRLSPKSRERSNSFALGDRLE